MIEAKPPGRGGDSEKTLTNLLLHEDGSFCSFGHEARTTYYEDAGKGLSNKLFFQNFKVDSAFSHFKTSHIHAKPLTLNPEP